MPFRAVVDAGIASVMISHVKFEEIDPDYPSTLSPAIITGLLRKEIGFDGLIVTDCMEMRAITLNYGAGESAVPALAGVDAMFFCTRAKTRKPRTMRWSRRRESGRLSMEQIDAANARLDVCRALPGARAGRPL